MTLRPVLSGSRHFFEYASDFSSDSSYLPWLFLREPVGSVFCWTWTYLLSEKELNVRLHTPNVISCQGQTLRKANKPCIDLCQRD